MALSLGQNSITNSHSFGARGCNVTNGSEDFLHRLGTHSSPILRFLRQSPGEDPCTFFSRKGGRTKNNLAGWVLGSGLTYNCSIDNCSGNHVFYSVLELDTHISLVHDICDILARRYIQYHSPIFLPKVPYGVPTPHKCIQDEPISRRKILPQTRSPPKPLSQEPRSVLSPEPPPKKLRVNRDPKGPETHHEKATLQQTNPINEEHIKCNISSPETVDGGLGRGAASGGVGNKSYILRRICQGILDQYQSGDLGPNLDISQFLRKISGDRVQPSMSQVSVSSPLDVPNSGRVLRKRKREPEGADGGSGGGDGGGGGGGKRPNRGKKEPSSLREVILRACPFYLTDPNNPIYAKGGANYEQCTKGILPGKLKEHLRRCHLRPEQCAKCGFRGDKGSVTSHKAKVQCVAKKDFERVSDETLEIDRKFSQQKGMSWSQTFEILFPGRPVPAEADQYINSNRCRHDLEEALMGYLQPFFPALLESFLESPQFQEVSVRYPALDMREPGTSPATIIETGELVGAMLSGGLIYKPIGVAPETSQLEFSNATDFGIPSPAHGPTSYNQPSQPQASNIPVVSQDSLREVDIYNSPYPPLTTSGVPDPTLADFSLISNSQTTLGGNIIDPKGEIDPETQEAWNWNADIWKND